MSRNVWQCAGVILRHAQDDGEQYPDKSDHPLFRHPEPVEGRRRHGLSTAYFRHHLQRMGAMARNLLFEDESPRYRTKTIPWARRSRASRIATANPAFSAVFAGKPTVHGIEFRIRRLGGRNNTVAAVVGLPSLVTGGVRLAN